VTPNSSVAVFGVGAVGLSVIQASKMAGASRIFAIDTNDKKFSAARTLGATDCLNPLVLQLAIWRLSNHHFVQCNAGLPREDHGSGPCWGCHGLGS